MGEGRSMMDTIMYTMAFRLAAQHKSAQSLSPNQNNINGNMLVPTYALLALSISPDAESGVTLQEESVSPTSPKAHPSKRRTTSSSNSSDVRI